MNRYPLFSARNLPACAAIMLLWIGVSCLLGLLLRVVTAGAVGWSAALAFAGMAVMSGMAIMFGASAVNLRKLRPGFERLARGERDPAVPPVWCPVLTMATRAAVELTEKVHTGANREVR
jgi:hypothetical protein